MAATNWGTTSAAGWGRSPPDSQPADVVEVLGSSSPHATPRSSLTEADCASGGDAGSAEEFARSTDRDLQQQIERLRKSLNLRLPDGGAKLRIRISEIEKELDRRRAAGQRKDATARRYGLPPPGGDDPFDFKEGDMLNLNTINTKCHWNSRPTTPTKSFGQDREAFTNELSHFSKGNHTCLKKDGQRTRTLAVRQSEIRKVSSNRADNNKHLNMDGNITDNRRKSGFKSCIRKQQKNNNVDSMGMDNELHIKDDTSGSPSKRWDCSYYQPAESLSLSNSKKVKENKDVVLLDDEDMEPTESDPVKVADKRNELVIYYPSRTDRENVELTYSHIECLEPATYLNSPVINFYIQYLRKSRLCGDLYMFNTYFYSKLEEALSTKVDNDSQFSKLRKWWKGVDIFRKAYIILPIHGQMHWSLIIICMPAEETESGPIILHLDSLELHSSPKVFGVIESYLKAEWRHLRDDSSYGIPFSGNIWRCLPRNIKKVKVEVPRQKNEYDCGIFMLYYIVRFIQEAPERMTRESLSMFGRKWFNPEETSGLRGAIRELLFDVFKNAKLDDEHSNYHSEGEDEDEDIIVTVA